VFREKPIVEFVLNLEKSSLIFFIRNDWNSRAKFYDLTMIKAIVFRLL